jgi:hypothetical protein
VRRPLSDRIVLTVSLTLNMSTNMLTFGSINHVAYAVFLLGALNIQACSCSASFAFLFRVPELAFVGHLMQVCENLNKGGINSQLQDSLSSTWNSIHRVVCLYHCMNMVFIISSHNCLPAYHQGLRTVTCSRILISSCPLVGLGSSTNRFPAISLLWQQFRSHPFYMLLPV